MGWKTFFQMTQDQFKEKYEKGEKWGDLSPALVQITNATTESIYGAGVITNTPGGPWYSAKVQHFVGAKTRLTCKHVCGFKANTTGRIGVYIGFYKDGELSKDPAGNNLFGIAYTLDEAKPYDIVEKHTFTVETENAKITLYLDDAKLGEYYLEAPLNSFVYAIYVPQVSGDLTFLVIYEVKAEYYDVLEDMIASMMNIMWIMIIVMMVIMGITMLVRGFRRERREKARKEAGQGG